MMKLWLLSRRDHGARIYDEFVEMLVRAPCEQQARHIAYEHIASRDLQFRRDMEEFYTPVEPDQLERWRKASAVWLDPNVTVAVVVRDEGAAGLVTANFKPG